MIFNGPWHALWGQCPLEIVAVSFMVSWWHPVHPVVNMWRWYHHLIDMAVKESIGQNPLLWSIRSSFPTKKTIRSELWPSYTWKLTIFAPQLKLGFPKVFSTIYVVGYLSRGLDSTSLKQFSNVNFVKPFWRKVQELLFSFDTDVIMWA